MTYRVRFHRLDLLLLLMTVIWGSNFTVVKIALGHIPQGPFNSLRLLVASAAFMATLAAREGLPRLSVREWQRILVLALFGQVLYQLCFVSAVARTTVANSSLIFAFTPIAVALLTAAVGHERVPALRWIGAVISIGGIYLVVGDRASAAGATMAGNLLSMVAMVMWAVYTVGTRPMLATRSPVLVNAYSMSLGSLVYLAIAWPSLRVLDWSGVTVAAWLALVGSGLLALYVSYIIWYTAVQRMGSTRTSIYSNVTPLVAMGVAYVWLGEPITARRLTGAAVVIAGLVVSRIERDAIEYR